ncbi:hypothetical protein AB0H58_03380 [Nocardia neocaledoniensis]|uniref:hypothetical protein n=1 Tax=Nocardia neocaledoniensis TaxID=236511 RepID=UPI0033C90F3D
MSEQPSSGENSGDRRFLGQTLGEFWGMIGAFGAIIGVIVAIVFGIKQLAATPGQTAAAPVTSSTSPPSPPPPSWADRYAPHAVAFPDLVGDSGVANGFGGASCVGFDPQPSESSYPLFAGATRIRCEVTGNGMLFDVIDISATASGEAGGRAFARAVLDDSVQVSRDHPTAGPDLTVTTRRGASADTATLPAFVVTSFPAEDHRARFLVIARWIGHPAAELLQTWWQRAPLGTAAH